MVQWFQNGRLQIKNCLVRSVHDSWIPQQSQKLTVILLVSSFLSSGGFGFYSYFYLPFWAHTRQADFQASSWKRNWFNVGVALFQWKAFYCRVKCDTDTHQEQLPGEGGAEPSLLYASQHRYVPKGSFPWHRWAGGLLCRGVGAGESASSSSLHVLSTGLQEEHREEPQNQSQAGDAFQTWILSQPSNVCIKENITRLIYNWRFHLTGNGLYFRFFLYIFEMIIIIGRPNRWPTDNTNTSYTHIRTNKYIESERISTDLNLKDLCAKKPLTKHKKLHSN